jgi:hypothetical protein
LVDEVLVWLYGEGDSATRDTFQSKLNELQVLGSPIELRRSENETRAPAIDELREAINYYKAFVNTTEEKYAHISAEKRQTVTDKVNEVEDWLQKMQSKQSELPKTADPVLLTSEIQNRKKSLALACNPIVNTPVPKKTPEVKKKEDTEMKTEQTGETGESTDSPAANTTPADNAAEESSPEPKMAEEGKIEEVDESKPTEQAAGPMDLD